MTFEAKKLRVLVFFSVIALGILIYYTKSTREKIMELNYVFTDTGPAESYDPLDGDKTVNLNTMRMLYATPLEISKDNNLISNILESFDYNKDTRIITFIVKKNNTFSDGSLITVSDVALAITRMAFFRPTFPVIKDIQGIKEWKLQNGGIDTTPEGIKVDGQKITIQLSRPHLNPLFRFCLELFSIIPKQCLDLTNGKMKCSISPSSGYYTITDSSAEKTVFSKRENLKNTAEDVPYRKINFVYKKLAAACDDAIADNTIVSASELNFIKEKCSEKLSKNQVHWTPAARFAGIVFNPKSTPFDSKENRRFFSEKVRSIIRNKYSDLIVEKSLFSSLLPGYISNDKFSKLDKDLTHEFKDKKISIVKSKGITQEAIIEAALSLGMEVHYLDGLSNDQLDKSFLENNLQVDATSSGFWAQDPVGDLSMLFTPNLHTSLSFVWPDTEFYRQLSEIENEADSFTLKNKMEKINEYLESESLISPVVHFRRVFISSKSISDLSLPQSITSPSPWQIIPVN